MILYTLKDNGYIDIGQLDSLEDVSVYVNMTNLCPCQCTFCLRKTKEMAKDQSLWLEQEPSVADILYELQKYDIDEFKEVVFCGFGEPTERIDDIIQLAGLLKLYRQDLPIRLNTNGLGNLSLQRDLPSLFKGRIDVVSISLNAPTKEEYLQITQNPFGIESFDAMLSFARECQKYVEEVVLTVVDIIGEEKVQQCQQLCDDLNIRLRVRPFEV